MKDKKNIVIIVLGVICIILLVLLIVFVVYLVFYLSRNNISGDAKPGKNKPTTNNTEITVVPTMQDKLNGDSAWAPTFQIVWNELLDKFSNGNIESKLDIVKKLNAKTYTLNDIDKSLIYTKYGNRTFELKNTIEKDLKKKFDVKSDILDNLDWAEKSDNIIIYSMLYHKFSYVHSFRDLGKSKFKNDEVKYFGGEASSDITLLYYKDKDHFAISIPTKENDEVILVKSPKGETFEEIYNNVVKLSKSLEKLKGTDFIKIPYLKIDLLRDYKELRGISFINKKNEEKQIDDALQTIKFELNESGGFVKSEAAITDKFTSINVDKKDLIFDNTFALFLKETKKDKPYLSLYVDNINNYK